MDLDNFHSRNTIFVNIFIWRLLVKNVKYYDYYVKISYIEYVSQVILH